MMDLPVAFVENMKGRLGDELPAFLRTYEEDYQRGLRLNLLRCADEVLLPDMGEVVPWAQEGRYIDVDSTAGTTVLHEAGAYYLQEPSAMLPAAVMNPQPGETILDLCAAPGGKSTQLGCRMGGKGLLVCNEPVPKRAQILSRNVERMGIPNALVVSAMPDRLAERWAEGFDGVQVDAPCSGEGMFRRHPETREEWTPESPAGCAKRQTEILDAAARLTRPGGRIVYSTCTLNAIENEDTVAAFCDRHPDFSPEPFSLPGAESATGMLTCYPHIMRGEGHFVALLRKNGQGESRLRADCSLLKPDKPMMQAWHDFAGDTALVPTAVLGSTMVSLPFCPDVKGLRVLRAGLHVGEVRGHLVVPDHAWAVSALTPDFPRVALREEEARRYQAGETVDVGEDYKGFVLPSYGNLVLGWGKVSDGVMKNHYPKGLRR